MKKGKEVRHIDAAQDFLAPMAKFVEALYSAKIAKDGKEYSVEFGMSREGKTFTIHDLVVKKCGKRNVPITEDCCGQKARGCAKKG